MAFPVVPVAAALGGGFALKWLYDKYGPASGRAPGEAPGKVTALTQGKTYAVILTAKYSPQDLAIAAQSGGGVGPIIVLGRLLRDTLDAAGFLTLGTPAPRSADAQAKLLSGASGDWVVNAKWTSTKSKPDFSPVSSIEGVQYYLLPSL